MATVERMIAALAEGGELTEEGGFTLDREQARKKMRKFQLDDPHRYVLCVVRAAKLLGATKVEFEVDSDDVIIRFGGDTLTREDLDELYGALFEDRTTDRIKARRELAIAMNAVMALDPKFVRIESGAVRASLDWESGDEISELPEVVPHTEVHVRDRFTAGRVVEFMRALDGSLAEVAVLKRGVWHSSLDVTVNRQPVSRRRRFDDPLHIETLELEGLRIELAILPNTAPSQVVYVVRGATASIVHRIGALPVGVHAVVEGDGFRLDVSQVNVVKDDAYERAISALKDLRDQAMTAYGRGRLGREDLPKHVKEYLVHRIYSVPRDRFELKSVRTDFEAMLLELPLWRTTRGDVLSSMTVIEWLASGKQVGISSETHGGFTPEGVAAVLFVDTEKQQRLATRIFGAIDDMGGRIEKEVAAKRNEEKWRARKRRPVLQAPAKAGRWAVVRFVEGDYEGEVAIGGGPGELELVVEGALFWWNELRGFAFNIAAVVEGPLKPNSKFTTPHRDAALRGAIQAVANAIDEAFMQFAAGAVGLDREGEAPSGEVAHALIDERMANELRRYIVERDEGRIRDKLLEAAGFSDSARKRVRAKEPVESKPIDIRAGTRDPRALLPLFPTIDGGLVSLDALAADATEHGKVRTAKPSLRSFPKGTLDRPVVYQRRYVEQILEDCFANSMIENAGRELERLRAKLDFLERPLTTWPPLPNPDLELDGLKGSVHLSSSTAGNVVRYFLEERLLATDENPSLGPLKGLEFEIWGDVRPNSRFDDATKPTKKTTRKMLRILAAQVFAELAAEAAAGNSLTQHQTEYVLGVVAEMFPMSGREWTDALCGGESPGTLDREVIRRTLRDKRKSASIPWPDDAFDSLIAGLEALASAKLVESLSDGPVPLELLLRHYFVERCVPVVAPATFGRTPQALDELVFIQDWRLEELVKRLFGTLALDDRTARIARLIKAEGFLARSKVSALGLEHMLAQTEVEGDKGVEGVVGVSVNVWEHNRTVLTVHHQRRFLVSIERPVAAGIVANLNDDTLEPTDDFSGIRSVDESRILEAAESAIPRLMETLASRYATLASSHKTSAASWLRRAIAEVRGDGTELPPGCASLPIYPTFPREGYSGVEMVSYDEIAREVEKTERLYYAEVGLLQNVEDLVVALDGTFAAMLRSSFKGRHSDYGPVLRARRARALAFAELRPLARREAPDDALVSVAIDDGEMEGQLWLSAGRGAIRSDIEIGIQDRRVRGLKLFKWIACEGTIFVPYRSLDPHTSDVALGRSQMGHLRSKAVGLYHELIDQTLAGRGNLAGARELLRETLVWMHRERSQWSHKRRWTKLWNKLETVPVLPLRDGRIISLEQAEILRPDEFSEYGMWSPKSEDPPEPQPEPAREPTPRRVEAPLKPDAQPEPEPEPEAKPKARRRRRPEPEPEPAPPSPNEELRDRVIDSLRAIRGWNERLLSRNWMTRIVVADEGELRSGQPLAVVDGKRVKINPNHPLTQRAAAANDPTLDAFVTIAVYGAIDEQDDDIEAWCQRRVTDRITQMLTGS